MYAEDPSRKFLPSIGFLKKYQEPKAHEHIRIDTGVQEGSEISMYYDPMISKLITWGKDRETAMTLMDNAIDEYVVQGVAHNLGFGQSIIANESFWKGDYSTAFIPEFYPDGFKGERLQDSDMQTLALACHKMKNISSSQYKEAAERDNIHNKTVYVTIVGKGEDSDRDWKVSQLSADQFEITCMETNKSTKVNMSGFNFEHNSLIEMTVGSDDFVVQYVGQQHDLKYDFYFCGGNVNTMIYDETQYKYKKHMAPPVKLDHSKSVLSPMPGAIVAVNVEVGQTVVDGQDLAIVEAMKMQNILKSERDGVIKSIKVKAGDSVAVDELLIEFE